MSGDGAALRTGQAAALAGVNIETLRYWERRGGRDADGVRVRVEAKLAEVEERIRSLERMRADLEAAIGAECDRLVGCDREGCPIDPEAPPPPRAHLPARA